MKNSIIATSILSILFLLISLIDEDWLPLAFLVWNILPILFIIDALLWVIDYLIEKISTWLIQKNK